MDLFRRDVADLPTFTRDESFIALGNKVHFHYKDLQPRTPGFLDVRSKTVLFGVEAGRPRSNDVVSR